METYEEHWHDLDWYQTPSEFLFHLFWRILDVQNYTLTLKDVSITTAVMKFSKNSLEDCFLGCSSADVNKWVCDKFSGCNKRDTTRLYCSLWKRISVIGRCYWEQPLLNFKNKRGETSFQQILKNTCERRFFLFFSNTYYIGGNFFVWKRRNVW